MVVVLVNVLRTDPRPLKRLLVRQARQNPKHHRRPRLDLNVHQPVAHTLRDVLEVHGGPFDEDSDGDEDVVGSGGSGGGLGRESREGGRRGGGEEVGCAGGDEGAEKGVGGEGVGAGDDPESERRE